MSTFEDTQAQSSTYGATLPISKSVTWFDLAAELQRIAGRRPPGMRSFCYVALAALLPSFVAASNATGGLLWRNLSVTSPDGSTALLRPCSGFVKNGHVCAVLGPSGAGKTTLLSAVGGTIRSSSGLRVAGEVGYVDGRDDTLEGVQSAGKVAWMQQNDHFFAMLTVRETLETAAYLELPEFTAKQREERVKSTMDSLGLRKLQNRKIGDPGSNDSLSGGERRRLSLALELLSSPRLFLGDEPTSGLDSNLSEKVVGLIKRLVRKREIPCFLSIHQPRSSIWRMIDSVILMAPGGRVAYMGDAEDAVPYFEQLGYECPSEYNPAEFLLDLVSVDSEDALVAAKDERRIRDITDAFLEYSKTNAPGSEITTLRRKAVPMYRHFQNSPARYVRRFGMLIRRSWRQNIRNHRVNLFRLIASAGNAYLFSVIFPSVRKGPYSAKSVADRAAMLTFGIINMGMIALMKTLDLFSKEKPIVMREQQKRQYSSFEYLLSKALAEVPLDTLFSAAFTGVLKMTTGIRIQWRDLASAFALLTVAGASMGFAIGAVTPNAEVAMSAGIPVMVILMCVGVINPSGAASVDSSPLLIRALKLLSPIHHGVRAACIGEFDGMEFGDPSQLAGGRRWFARGRALARDLPRMGALALVQNGNQVLQELGLSEESYARSMKRLAVLSVANLVFSWACLQQQSGSGTTRIRPVK